MFLVVRVVTRPHKGDFGVLGMQAHVQPLAITDCGFGTIAKLLGRKGISVSKRHTCTGIAFHERPTLSVAVCA